MQDVPTRTAWTLYGHSAANADNYTRSYLRMCGVVSFADFWRMWHHTHPDLIGEPARIVAVKGQRITAWSFFRADSRPEWEHASNTAGTVVSARVALSAAQCTAVWMELLVQCVLGNHPDNLNGVQITRKSTRVRRGEPGLYMKIDVWLATREVPTAWIRAYVPHAQDA